MILWLNIRHEKQKTEAAERRSALALSLSYQKNIFLYFIQSKRCRPSLFCFVYLACIHFSACSMCTMHHLPEAIPIRKRSTCLIHSILGMAFFVIQKKCVFLSTAYRAAIVQLYAIWDRNFVLLFRCNKIEENNVKSRLYHTLVVLLLCCKTLKLLSPTHIIILHY